MAIPVRTTATGVRGSTQLIQLQDVTGTGKVIGKGAYGRVIEVYVHGTLCAAKEIHPILVEGVSPTECEATKQSFLTECVNASRIHHPNIVQVLGIHYPTPEAKLPWLVMEMMECSIKGMLEKYKKDKVPVHIKLSILVDISQGLEFLHGQDIIHRDLSSNNVLLTIHFTAKIADLGVAKVIEHNKMKTQTQAPGTSDFMPPEALLRKPKYGKPVDVFSLGCIACHVMSHQWPEPKDLFPEGSLTAHTEVQRREIFFHSFTDSSFKMLIQQCLHNLPEQRPLILAVCIQLKDLKTSATKEVPNTTANSVELFNAVQNEQKEIIELRSSLAQMKTALQAKDEELQEKDREMQQKVKAIQANNNSMNQLITRLREEKKQLQEKNTELQQKDKTVLEALKEVQEMDKGIHEENRELYYKIKEYEEREEKTHGKMQEKIKELLENVTQKQEQLKSKVTESSEMELYNHKTNCVSGTSGNGVYHIPQGSFTAMSRNGNTTKTPTAGYKKISFPRVDPRDLPPPDIEDNDPSVDFVSHINPSSDYDDEQLIPGSTHLGYRNLPKTNSNPLAGAGTAADLQVTSGGYVPYTLLVTAASTTTKYPSPKTARSCERDRSDRPSGVSQFSQNQPPYGAEHGFRQDGSRQDYLRSTPHGSGDEMHSLPTNSVRSTTGNTRTGDFQSFGNELNLTGGMSPSKIYVRQKSVPASPNSGEVTVSFTTSSTVTPADTMMTSTATRTPVTYGNVPGVSTTFGDLSTAADTTTTAVVYGNVPMGEPVTTTETVSETVNITSMAAKYGNLDLDKLKRKRKQKTANIHVPLPDKSDNQPLQHDLRDLTTLKNYLKMKKDMGAKVDGINDSTSGKAPQNYFINFDKIAPPRATPAAKLDTPASKGPVAAPRAEKKIVEYWQCACCETVNKSKCLNCKKCTVKRGDFSVSHAYCGLCNLLVYISEERMYASKGCCAMCKEKLETHMSL